MVKMRADLLLRDGRILDLFSGTFFRGDIAISDGRIAGFGASDPGEVRDLRGRWVVPGLIDSHVHIESSQLSPAGFVRAVLPHGTTCVIADPHEIANVLGIRGIRYMLDATEGLPFRAYFMAPSCVPASPYETSGAVLDHGKIAEVLAFDRVLGLGEVMNYPGVVGGDPEVMAKLAAAAGRPIDGHAPGLSAEALWSYVSAGPRTDHECTSLAEAEEKLRAGMHILIREGTTARNLDTLLPLLTEGRAPFVHLCTDDRHPDTLLDEGHIDGLVRRAISSGVPAHVAIGAATIHTARAYGLDDIGAIAATSQLEAPQALEGHDLPRLFLQHLVEREAAALLSAEVIEPGGGKAIEMRVECLKVGVEFEIELSLDMSLMKEFSSANPGSPLPFTGVEDVLECVRAFGERLWKAEGEFASAHAADEPFSDLSDFYSKAPSGVLLRIGWGSGILGTTIDLLLSEELRRELGRELFGSKHPRFPWSRRVVYWDGRCLPLGWVELSF